MTEVAARPFYRSPWFVAGAIGVVALTGIKLCGGKRLAELPVLAEVPAFELVAEDGRAFGSADLDGRIWIASFIFTTCPTVCPRVSEANADLQRRLAEAGLPARLVSFTVDPTYDTPERLTEYAGRYDADPAIWTFVTGAEQAVFDLVTHGFKVAMGTKEAGAGGVVDIAHSTKLVFVDQLGRVRHYFDTDDLDQRALIVDYVRHLLATPPVRG